LTQRLQGERERNRRTVGVCDEALASSTRPLFTPATTRGTLGSAR
jgi:hypothetical protein